MPNPQKDPTPVHADLALAVYLESVADGRRVLWIGDSSTGGPRRIEKVAESLDVRDTRKSRKRRRGTVSYRGGPLGLAPSTIDLVVVPDVAVLDEPGARLAELASGIGEDGLLVVGTAADDAGYDLLRSELAASFGAFRLLGQGPFAAHAIADFQAADPDVLVDGTLLLDGGDIERYLAVAGGTRIALEDFSVIQVPALSGSGNGEVVEALERSIASRTREVEALREELTRASDRLSAAQTRLRTREGELAASRSYGENEVKTELTRYEQILKSRGQLVSSLQSEVDRRGVLVRDLVEELRTVRASGPSGSTGPSERDLAQVEALNERVVETSSALNASREEVAGLSQQIADLSQAVAQATDEVSAKDAAIEHLREELDQHLARQEPAVMPTMLPAPNAVPEPFLREPSAAPDDVAPEEVSALAESERRLSSRVGELSGQLVAAQDLVDNAEQDRDRARAESLKLTAQLSTVETQIEGLKMGYETRIAMMRGDLPTLSGTDESVSRELGALEDELTGLHGEVAGLRMRLSERETALANHAQAETPSEAESNEFAALLESESRRREDVETRARELSALIATRDALITRLQMDLVEEERVGRGYEEEVTRLRGEVSSLRDALTSASEEVDQKRVSDERAAELSLAIDNANARATDAVEELERLKGSRAQEQEALEEARSANAHAQSRLAALETELDEARAVAAQLPDLEAQVRRAANRGEAERGQTGALEEYLRDARARIALLETERDRSLSSLRESRAILQMALHDDELEVVSTEITSVGTEAPPLDTEEERLEMLERRARDHATVVRSLEKQLRERGDRIRALERRLAGATAVSDEHLIQQELLELEERIARLNEELNHERDARQKLERAAETSRPALGGELQRLTGVIQDRDRELEAERHRGAGLSRDVQGLRGVCAQARRDLEELIAAATAAGDASTAERLGAVLSSLSDA